MAMDLTQTRWNLNQNSTTGGVETITAAATPVSTAGSNQPCKRVLVKALSGDTVYVNIGATATASHPVLDNVFVEFSVNNTNLLNFLGAASGDKVFLIWFD